MGKSKAQVLGERIKDSRRKRKLTQVELAVIVDISPSYVASIEQGLRRPSLKVLEKLAKALKTKPSDLLQ